MMSLLLVLYFLLSLVAFGKWYKYKKEKELLDLISWSAIGDYCRAMGRTSYVREPTVAVFNAQFDANIETKYRLSYEADYTVVIELIKDFQLDLMRSYFKRNRVIVKSKYAVSAMDYFMFALYVFLCDYQSEYVLSDSAVVFCKMNYITYLYCKRSKILKSYVPDWNERNLREALDEVLNERS